MYKLTSQDEKFILNELRNCERKGNGSSRICFALNDAIAQELGLNTNEWVVKLAVGLGGRNQSFNEIKTYKEYHREYDLAEIYAYGNYIIIMEAVYGISNVFCEALDCDGSFMETVIHYQSSELYWQLVEEYGYDWFDEDNEDCMSYVKLPKEKFYDLKDGWNLAWSLFNELEGGPDCGQIAKSIRNNYWVAYDYGFSNCARWDSPLTGGVARRPEVFESYIQECIANIDASNELTIELEKKIAFEYEYNWYPDYNDVGDIPSIN